MTVMPSKSWSRRIYETVIGKFNRRQCNNKRQWKKEQKELG